MLLFSRALRVAFWAALVTFFAIGLIGQDTCHGIDEYDLDQEQKTYFTLKSPLLFVATI